MVLRVLGFQGFKGFEGVRRVWKTLKGFDGPFRGLWPIKYKVLKNDFRGPT